MKKTKSLLCLLFAFIIMTASSMSAYAADITQLTDPQDIVTAGYNPYSTEGQSRSIIGDDGRVTVGSPASYPYSAIAFLSIKFSCGCSGVGNGFMVSKNCMLTAGHCVVCEDHGNDAASITATFGYQSSSNYLARVTATPSNSVIYHDPQFTGTQKNYDYGYVVFNTNVGNTTGWFGLASRSDSTLDGMNISVSGYEGLTLKRSDGNVTSVATNRIKYDADTVEGQSGSPVYFNDSTNGYLVVAIHTDGTDLINWKNSGWRVTSTFINELRSLGYVS